MPASVYFNNYGYLLDLPIKDRKAKEIKIMSDIQSDPTNPPKYYQLDNAWIDKWLKYVKSSDDDATPPGPIDNDDLAT